VCVHVCAHLLLRVLTVVCVYVCLYFCLPRITCVCRKLQLPLCKRAIKKD